MKWENRGSKIFCGPPIEKVKLLVPSPPSAWLNFQGSHVKTRLKKSIVWDKSKT